MNKVIGLLVILVMTSTSVLAEEDDLDLDFYFSTKQKSTLDDFPLQEIDSDELSNAAIAGALQANSSGSNVDAKPIHEEQKEKSNKKKVSATGKDKDQLEAERTLQFSQQYQPVQVDIPKFITPSIRHTTINSTTVER